MARRLAPKRQPCDVLVLDNASVHKVGMAEWLVEWGVERLFLPPYSLDFSPVERAWSKLKTKLRTALEQALYMAIKWIARADKLGGFDHCGYYATLV